MASLSLDRVNGEAVLGIVRESKVFLELTAIDLDVDSAFELDISKNYQSFTVASL
jgi:hypothetical protein